LKEDFRRATAGDSHPNARANRFAAGAFMDFFRPVWSQWQARALTES
jgi:hypothetical protein